MKKMMRKCWLMLGVLAVSMSPLLTSCSDDDENGGGEENLPYLKVNGGNVNFAVDQREVTIASIEANNEVKLSKKPSWISDVVITKNADGTYSAVITREYQNDTELRSDSIVFTASTASAKVMVTCDGQKLDATYTIDKVNNPADGFFGERNFTFSVLRTASARQDTVLVYMPGRGLMPVNPDRVSIRKANAVVSEAINTTTYIVEVSDLDDKYGDIMSTFYFFVMSEAAVESFNPNKIPAPVPDFIIKQSNSAFPIIPMTAELEITPGTAKEVTVIYNHTVIPELQASVIDGFPDLWGEDPLAGTTPVAEITLTKKSSTADGNYTTVVYTVNAQQCMGGTIVFLGKDGSGKYVRDEEDTCYEAEIYCTIVSE